MMRLRGRLDEERRGLSGGPTRAAFNLTASCRFKRAPLPL